MDIYTIDVAVKPYVKAYLEHNFGQPADLRSDPELSGLVVGMLKEGSTRLDRVVTANYPAIVKLRISKDTFERHGFTLTKTETVRFNSFFEKRIKFFARAYIAYHSCLGISIAKCIRDFQKIYGFSEDVWNYDAIKKDFDRHGSKIPRGAFKNFQSEFKKVFLEILSESGTPFRVVGILPESKKM